jgi:hypothetical protein
MNYIKPEVALLGFASTLIESMMVPKPGVMFDGITNEVSFRITPAYDLDE